MNRHFLSVALKINAMKQPITILLFAFFSYVSFGAISENLSAPIMRDCEIFSLPFLENFSNATPPSLPECYDTLTLGYEATIEVVDFPYNTPPHSVRMTHETESQAYLILPEFEPTTNELFISFSARLNGGSNLLDLGFMTNPADTATFVLLETFEVGVNWDEYMFTIPHSVSFNGYLVIRYAYNGYPYYGSIFLDDIFVSATEECPAPFRLSVEELTDQSAQMHWEPFGTANLWDVEWGPEGFNPGEGALVEEISETFLDISDLEPNSTYQFIVRSHCADEQTGSWSLPHTFQTYSDDECFYTFILHSILGDGWPGVCMHLLQDGEVVKLLGQGFYSGHTQEVLVNFLHGSEFEVLMTVGNPYSGWLGLEILNPEGVQIYHEVPVGPMNEGTTIFTDVALCFPSPCPRPESLSASSITSNSAILSWNEAGDANLWQIEYGLQGFEQGEGIMIDDVSENLYQVTGLEPYSTYEFRVRAVCNDTSVSHWSSRKIFDTPCEPSYLPFAENFDNVTLPYLPDCWTYIEEGVPALVETHYYIYHSPPHSLLMYLVANSMAIVILPPIEGDVSSLSLKFRAQHNSGAEELDIGVITNPADASSFTLVESVVVPHNWEMNEYWIYFSDYTGEEGRIAIRGGDANGGDPRVIFIDDVEVESLSQCASPYNLNAFDVTENSATLDWSDVENGLAWDVEWGVAPLEPGEGTLVQGLDQTSMALDDLLPSTRYQFIVRAHCPENETSMWSAPHPFATSCDVFEAPFPESFDDLEIHELPLCWTATGSEEGEYTITLSSSNHLSPPNSLLMNREGHNYSMFISPELAQPLHELILRFSVMFINGEANVLQVGTVTNPEDPDTFSEFSSFELSGPWEDIEVDFSGYDGTDKHIALKLGSVDEPEFGVISIDDLEISMPTYEMIISILGKNNQPVEGAEIIIEGHILYLQVPKVKLCAICTMVNTILW